MKRYIVFLKQVPLSTKVEMDPKTHTLKRSSALTQTNPNDLYALQAALDLKQTTGAEVVAVSMGQDTFGWHNVLSALLVFAGVYLVTTSKSRAQMETEKNGHPRANR